MTRFGYPTSGPGSTRCSTGSVQGSAQPTKDTKTTTPRKPEKGRKWSVAGWDDQFNADDGIVAWTKRQKALESKRGTKKHPASLDEECRVSIHHRCPNIDDIDIFMKSSLHDVYKPREKTTPNVTNQKTSSVATLKYTNNVSLGTLMPTEFKEDHGDNAEDDDDNGRQANTFRENNVPVNEETEKRSKSVQDIHAQAKLERSNTHMKIKRLLKFSRDRRTTKADEDDEGYCSKTSSAERTQDAVSDGEESGANIELEKSKNYRSMMDLSELPSNSHHPDHSRERASMNALSKQYSEVLAMNRARFSYTHQPPTICHLPDPNVALAHDSLRIERKIESEDSTWSYAKLKRNKELNRCYQPELLQPTQESTVYNIDNMKPVTLVLRKITIQNSEETCPLIYQTQMQPMKERPPDIRDNRHPSRNSNTPSLRAGSNVQRNIPSQSRAGSAISRSGSSYCGSPTPHALTPRGVAVATGMAQTTPPHGENKAANNSIKPSQQPKQSSQVRDVRVVHDPKPKDGMWSQEYSYIDRQTTNYSIGELLPAMDKSIYTQHTCAPKFVTSDHASGDTGMTTTEILDMQKNAIDDGFLLLKKGIDILSKGNDKLTPTSQDYWAVSHNEYYKKQTLGPPPFRPNQTRHPLMRSLTVVVNNRRDFSPRSSSNSDSSKSKPTRVSSEKGYSSGNVDDDRETQKKLKEAFSQFYKNRPKEIGKEFRRMQTMWNS
ncbi:uncharacterized protein LOC127861960 isoform X2 [Dreissena polymorpha]|uniref:uncharacterized protein LOC127861960 isoform X2 n=1 Tax=Dreissena polymorpha TaxID=45954 RepID=UPI0022643E47|nr:uncharacterized protein LOC127861960 isoform X2 [Dreissena polymorpha]